jgi:hypothetical protein
MSMWKRVFYYNRKNCCSFFFGRNNTIWAFLEFLYSKLWIILYLCLVKYVCTVASKKFWSSMSFQNLVRVSQIKKIHCLIMTKCQKNDKKTTINVIKIDDRLWYLRPFYNGAFSSASKHDFDDQFFFLLATVHFVYHKCVLFNWINHFVTLVSFEEKRFFQ